MIKKTNLITMFLVFVVLLANLVFAFGIAAPYWRGNPLNVYPGETITVSLSLQNMVGTEDITVRMDITKGSEIASIKENEYLVKLGTKDTEVPIEIKIPQDVPVDTNYQVTVTSKTVTPGGAGVVFGTGMDTTFDVLVVTKPELPEETKTELQEGKLKNLYGGLIVIIAVIVIIAIIILKKTKRTSQK